MPMNPNQLRSDETSKLLAGDDLLIGAKAIRDFLLSIGMHESIDPYYLRRTKRWAIGNTSGRDVGTGGRLIATKSRLLHQINEITRDANGWQRLVQAMLPRPYRRGAQDAPAADVTQRRAGPRSPAKRKTTSPPKRRAHTDQLPAE
jgi:hypothetical protein